MNAGLGEQGQEGFLKAVRLVKGEGRQLSRDRTGRRRVADGRAAWMMQMTRSGQGAVLLE